MNTRLAPVDPALIHQAFLEAFADYAMDASGTTEEHLLLRMRKNAVDYTVSPGTYNSDQLVGFTLIGLDEWDGIHSAYDAGTGIIPRFRGQGLAKRMFEHALPELESQRVKQFVLEVLQSNEPAIRAYEKSGFTIARELKCFLAEVPALRGIEQDTRLVFRKASFDQFEALAPEADWLPSFENRFTAHRAIPNNVECYGAFDGQVCAGAVAYCRDLNWLLSLVVKRTHRRRGIGSQLLRHLASRLPEGATRLAALNVDGKDRGMQTFFKTLGFESLVDQYEMHLQLG